MKIVKPVPLDRNGVQGVLQEAIDRHFDQVYVVGFQDKQAYFMGSKLDSNMEMIGAIEMVKMQIFETSGK